MGSDIKEYGPPDHSDWEPKIGQHLYIAGTGQWWSGQHFLVIVVDLCEPDKTVKVRYPDGGFKRFKVDVLKTLLTNQHEHIGVGHKDWTPVAGEHVYLAGTSKWWTGQTFRAVIVDVRKSDDTVKVRYMDGRFKRFNTSVLKLLVTERQSSPEMWEEWQPPLREEQTCEMSQLHDEIMLAVKERNFLKAADLQNKFHEMSLKMDGAGSLSAQLREAVNRGDYLDAHRIQQEMKEEKGKLMEDFPVPLQEDIMSGQPGSIEEALERAAKRAFTGGVAGASAMVFQVACFYWLRTTMNYQYRFGTSTSTALRTLYLDGGVSRFYRGFGPALLQGPMSRFADTAANAGVLALFEETNAQSWPIWMKTVFASLSAAAMRIALIPVDTVKTLMQVHGKDGLLMLASKYRLGGTPIFFHGAMAASAATFIGHYPWFMVFNTLNERIPTYRERPKNLLRNACIGFCASVCSDTMANVLRVVKTCRQTNENLSYAGIVKTIVDKDGVASLLGRGLKTRILANAGQGVVFSVLYKMFEERIART